MSTLAGSAPAAPTVAAAELRFGRCVVRPAKRELLVDGMPGKLGARAFDLLLTLVQHRDRMISKHELLELVWPGMIVEENNLQVHISTLRKLLGPEAITTIPGRGYRFTAALEGLTANAESAPASSMAGGVATPAATAPTVTTEKGNLPSTVPTLFGRDEDVVALAKLVTLYPIVTIVGAGGLGKTRLAQAAAHTLRDAYADGAWLVELAPVFDTALLPAAVAQALGFKLAGKKSAQDEVIDVLHNRALLLVLDNCEHLVAAASAFAQALLDHAPGVHLLATSQELLKVNSEHLYRLAPLALPAANELAAARASGAVALFVERVSALQPAFTLTVQNVADASDICRQLDGLPLAIELAAARVPLLGVAGVRERLNERFRMLTGGARAAPRRHHTLRDMLDWSHSLLTADERAVFRRAGVFVGGFTLPVAQHALSDTHLDEWAVLDHLGALVDKSLLVADLTEPPRYRLLESTRAYALEKLREAGELAATRERHARTMLAFFDEAYEQMWSVTRDERFERCLPDIDNLRAALDWAQDLGDAALHIALAGASSWMWSDSGQVVEGKRRSELAVTRIDAATAPALEARLLYVWTFICGLSNTADLAVVERAANLYRSLGDSRGLYLVACYAVGMAANIRDVAAGEQWLREAVLLHEAGWPLASRWHLLVARGELAYYNHHRYEEFEAGMDEILSLCTTLGDQQLMRVALANLALSSSARGNFAQAVERGRALIALLPRDRFGVLPVYALGNYAAALTELGELDEAVSVLREVAPMLARQGLWLMWLDALALLALKRGRIRDAALARGRSDARFVKFNQQRPGPITQRIRDKVLSGLQQALSAAELERLLAEGAALTDEEAARLALSD